MNYRELEEKVETTFGTNLIFPYNLAGKDKEDYIFHEHTWYDLMIVIFKEYKIFSIEGYEGYYSQQEIDLINMLVQNLNEEEENKDE